MIKIYDIKCFLTESILTFLSILIYEMQDKNRVESHMTTLIKRIFDVKHEKNKELNLCVYNNFFLYINSNLCAKFGFQFFRNCVHRYSDTNLL